MIPTQTDCFRFNWLTAHIIGAGLIYLGNDRYAFAYDIKTRNWHI